MPALLRREVEGTAQKDVVSKVFSEILRDVPRLSEGFRTDFVLRNGGSIVGNYFCLVPADAS